MYEYWNIYMCCWGDGRGGDLEIEIGNGWTAG